MKLSVRERLMLANQYSILKQLDAENATYYEEMIDILQGGYEIFYSSALTCFDLEGLPPQEGEFVLEVLDLYQALGDYRRTHPDDAAVAKHPWASFVGFDGNNEGAYLSFARFLMNRQGKYAEVKTLASGDNLNSHSLTIAKYRSMLAKWDASSRSLILSEKQVLEILDA